MNTVASLPASIRDTLIVAANNPVSHGGLKGLQRIMLAQAERLDALASPAPSVEPTCHAREIAALRKVFPNASTSELVDAIFAVKNAFNKDQP